MKARFFTCVIGLISVCTANRITFWNVTATSSHDSVCSEELDCLCLRRDIILFHKFKSSSNRPNGLF